MEFSMPDNMPEKMPEMMMKDKLIIFDTTLRDGEQSPGGFDAVRAVAETVKASTVCSLARATENDVRRAGEAIRPARSGRIHTFISPSPIHMQHKLRMTPVP